MDTDKNLTCCNCAKAFVFTAAEQQFFALKGLLNDPKRCPDCRLELRNWRKTKSGGEASAEFQRILDQPTVAFLSVLAPLAHLGIARAAAMTGDTDRSRKAYQDFFGLWKDAGPDVPILKQAKAEFTALPK